MENKIYYIAEIEEIRDEKGLRKLLLQNEVAHIAENLNDYIDGFNNLSTQCDIIARITTLTLEDIIEQLEENWSYTLYDNTIKWYNTSFIFSPKTPIETIEETIEDISSLVFRFIGVERLGFKHMVYEIKGFSKGYYVNIEHESPVFKVEEIQNTLKKNMYILNYCTECKENERKG